MCRGGGDPYGVEFKCTAPSSLPTAGPDAVTKITTSNDLVIASNADGSKKYVFKVWPWHDTSSSYHTVTQTAGITRIEMSPVDNMLVWDRKGRMTIHSDPAEVPWALQHPPPGVNIIATCTGGRSYAAALTSDGRVTVRILQANA
jgi:hypothetical protein